MSRDRNARHRTDESILAAVKRTLARKNGASAAEVRVLMYTHPDRSRAGQLLQLLVKTGEAVKAMQKTAGARRPQERYFASAECAAGWKAIPCEPSRRKTTEKHDAQRAKLKGAWASKPVRAYDKLDPAAPVVCNVQPTICPHGIDHRHTFTGTPGRWIDSSQCRPWAASIGG